MLFFLAGAEKVSTTGIDFHLRMTTCRRAPCLVRMFNGKLDVETGSDPLHFYCKTAKLSYLRE